MNINEAIEQLKYYQSKPYVPTVKKVCNIALETIEALQAENERLADETIKLMKENKQEIDRLKEKLNAVLQDFYQYVQGGKEICAFCLYDYECEPGETICGATYKGFKWRGLNEREDL